MPQIFPDRLAVFDMGSNTARLIIVGYTPNRNYQLLDQLRFNVRIAEQMGTERLIRPAAFERGLSAFKSVAAYCHASSIQNIRATATNAVRDAKNGATFLKEVHEQTGLEVEILSGEREAYYGALAALNSLAFVNGVVMDLGGGSAQLSRVKDRQYFPGVSYPIGAVRTSEAFFSQHPPRKKDVRIFSDYVRTLLKGTPALAEGELFAVMGGTVRNLAKIHARRNAYSIDLRHGYILPQAALAELTEELLNKSVAERKAISGLSSDRADIIAAGALVIHEVTQHLGAQALLISGQGVREGLFFERLFAERPSPILPSVDAVRTFHSQGLEDLYHPNYTHNQHVQKLALTLFDQLTPLHGYGPWERDLLAHAAHLHDIGMRVSYYDHHKHGLYLIMNAALPGFSHREQALIALMVRYHRKGTPDFQGLDDVMQHGDLKRLQRLTALLRLAEYLERSKAQLIQDVTCYPANGHLTIKAYAKQGVNTLLEIQEATSRSGLLAEAYDVAVDIQGV